MVIIRIDFFEELSQATFSYFFCSILSFFKGEKNIRSWCIERLETLFFFKHLLIVTYLPCWEYHRFACTKSILGCPAGQRHFCGKFSFLEIKTSVGHIGKGFSRKLFWRSCREVARFIQIRVYEFTAPCRKWASWNAIQLTPNEMLVIHPCPQSIKYIIQTDLVHVINISTLRG